MRLLGVIFLADNISCFLAKNNLVCDWKRKMVQLPFRSSGYSIIIFVCTGFWAVHSEGCIVTSHRSIEGTLLSTLHFLLLGHDPNLGIAAKLGQDYTHTLLCGSSPTEGQLPLHTSHK